MFENWFKLDSDSRCKISLGILEFFLDAVSFNTNDEFGSDSLNMCAPIEASFGYDRLNEAKLINYESIFTGKQLEAQMSNRLCYSNRDCVYSDECATKCNNQTHKCSSTLTKPQIINFCLFVKKFLSDNLNVSLMLDPLLDKCLKLKLSFEDENILFGKNEIPARFDRNSINRSEYWKNSHEFIEVTNEIYHILWENVRFLKDPVKPKKKKN